MAPQVRTVEQVLAELGERAHGVVTRSELLSAGISAAEVKGRVQKGSLIVEFRGVYRVGHRAPSRESRYLAAVRACGPRALLSGCSAGHLLGLIKGRVPEPEVTAPTERRVPGVAVRRSRRIDGTDAITWRGVPVTSVPRTLVALAAVLPGPELARACHEAGILHGTAPAHVAAVLTERPNSPGAVTLRRVLIGDERVLLSKLERGFIARLEEAGLPLPQTNRLAGGRRVDCRWPQHRLTVELDSYRCHNSRHSWEQGRRRERQARARGDEFRQYTWTDVFEDWHPTLRDLRGLLLGSGCSDI